MNFELDKILPEGWEIGTIGEITLPYLTEQPSKKANIEFKYIDISSIDNSTQTITNIKTFLGKDAPSRARRIVNQNDILFSTVRTYLKNIARVPAEFNGVLTSTGIAVLRCASGIDSNFLFYYVLSDKFIREISSTMDGTLYPAVTDRDVMSAKVFIPPLNEQRRIVAKIEALKARSQRVKDALLDIPQLLDQFRQSVLAAAFRGDLTADWREHNPDVEPASVLLEKIQEDITHQSRERRRSKDESYHSLKENFNNIGGANLPELWQLIQIRQICISSFYGPRFGKDEYVEDGIPSIRTTDMTDDGDIILQNPPKLNIPKNKIDDFRVLPGDLLVTRSGSIGVMAVFRSDYIAIPSAYLIRFRFSLMVNINYIFYYLKSPVGQTLLGLNSTSVTQSNINAEAIKNISIPIPPIEEQQEIVRRIQSLLKFVNQIKQQYQETKTNLDQLDQSILAKAFRGELVPQDPNDEPASVLVERIRTERDKLETKTVKKSTVKTSTRRAKNTQTQTEEPVQLELGLQ